MGKSVSLRQRLDPRLHLAAAIGWTVFAIILLAALAGANLASREAERRTRTDIERLLTQFATQIHLALDMSLATRRSILQTTATQIAASYDRGADALRHHVEAVQAQFPEFVWLGVVDEHGQVMAATGGILHGADVSAQSWFQEGQQHALFGDARHYPLLEQALPTTLSVITQFPPLAKGETEQLALSKQSPGFVAAVPILQPSGQRIGVLGAWLSWDWIKHQQSHLLHELETDQPLDLLLITADHRVLMGPAHWLGRTLTADSDLSDGGSYMVGQHSAGSSSKAGLDWSVVLRQDANTALRRARTVHHTVFLLVLVAGFISAIMAVLATGALTRRLTLLADQTQAIRLGKQQSLLIPAGDDEIARIGAILADLVAHLQLEERRLTLLNAELDAEHAERTLQRLESL